MLLFIALLAIAPLAALIVGGSNVRRGLIITILVTATCVALLDLWFDYPDDMATIILFHIVVLPLACGVLAGTVATWFVASRRAFGLPIVAGVVGTYAGLALGAFVRPFADPEDLLWSLWLVTPHAVVASSFAVIAAALGSRRS
jgi:hypothetical protein